MGQAFRHRLQTEVERLSGVVNQARLSILSEEDRQDVKLRLNRVQERLRTVEEETLVVGLLGGTGVGKSTLMNRLAERDIAAASFRRPHTDKVLIYTHEDAPRPSFIQETPLEVTVVEHRAAAVRQILLCDLPDFDSLAAEHSETVHAFLEHLDLLVWVTSPEKYADRRMYHVMRQVPKAGSNFVYVLNKADQLMKHDQGVEGLQKVSRSFSEHLDSILVERGETGLSAGSKLYVLSATEAGPGWNQFGLFQDHLFAQRDLKQVARIKNANLDQELRQIVQLLNSNMEEASRAESILQHAEQDLQETLKAWQSRVQEGLQEWVEADIKPLLAGCSRGGQLLVGPGRWIWVLANEWHSRRLEPGEPWRIPVPEHILSLLKDCQQHVQARVSTSLLQHQVPDMLRKQIEQELESSGTEDLKAQWQGFVRTAVHEFRPRSRFVFTLGQRLVYALLTLLLLLSLGGREAWVGMLRTPGPTAGMDLFFSLITTLFSATGLASLLSFGLLGSLAGARFFRRFRTVLDQDVDAYAKALEEELSEHWSSNQSGHLDRLARYRQELRESIAAVREVVD